MFLAECHTHTKYSPDAKHSVADMAKAAYDAGATYICFTDHVDDCAVNDPVTYYVAPFAGWDERAADIARVQEEYAGRMEIRIGAEVGSGSHMPDVAERIYNDRGLDFVIGSLHSLRDEDDFYRIEYTSLDQCLDLTEKYFREMTELAETGLCDVLGHIGLPKRYMKQQGFSFDVMLFEDYIREIYSVIIPKGIGIELNTSGMRDILQQPIPQFEAIKLYREMGGEIITVGSDSHTPDVVCAGIRDGYELMREAGFEYVTVFREHKPFFEKI